jgi:hypothetical protein
VPWVHPHLTRGIDADGAPIEAIGAHYILMYSLKDVKIISMNLTCPRDPADAPPAA